MCVYMYLGDWTESRSRMLFFFSFLLFDLNGSIIILKTLRGGRDIGIVSSSS